MTASAGGVGTRLVGAAIGLCLLASCNTSGARVLPSQILRKVSSIQLTASRLTTFRYQPPLDSIELGEYPEVLLPAEGWKARRWTEPVTSAELAALIEFLDDEREKYANSGKYTDQVRRIDEMKASLAKGGRDSSFFSYLYKPRPSGPRVQYGDWLYFFYLDERTATVTELTNAFR